ncbi:MAG: hypothetical protein ACE5K4_11990 [Candidatus Hydrothermarchaeota archaeon]
MIEVPRGKKICEPKNAKSIGDLFSIFKKYENGYLLVSEEYGGKKWFIYIFFLDRRLLGIFAHTEVWDRILLGDLALDHTKTLIYTSNKVEVYSLDRERIIEYRNMVPNIVVNELRPFRDIDYEEGELIQVDLGEEIKSAIKWKNELTEKLKRVHSRIRIENAREYFEEAGLEVPDEIEREKYLDLWKKYFERNVHKKFDRDLAEKIGKYLEKRFALSKTWIEVKSVYDKELIVNVDAKLLPIENERIEILKLRSPKLSIKRRENQEEVKEVIKCVLNRVKERLDLSMTPVIKVDVRSH